MWVKICGVRSVEQARHAQACGADAIGLNLHPPSPRSLSPVVAAEIAAAVEIETVLVVVNTSAADLAELVEYIKPGAVQLHGDQPPGFGADLAVSNFRAFRARPGVAEVIEGHAPERFLLDAWVPGREGGTGMRVPSEMAREIGELGQMILAGGLTPDNVGQVIAEVGPWGVDVASGVESAPGAQDPQKVADFIRAARGETAQAG